MEQKNSMNQELHNRTLYREMAARADTIDADQRTAELTFSSEQPIQRWFGEEILCHDAECVDLSRLQQIGVLLWNHNMDTPIGKIEKAWIGDDKRGHATVRFDDDSKAEEIFQKVQSGTLRGVSVGYRISVIESVEGKEKSTNGRFTGPCEVATRWEPYEISIVSVPADAGVGIGRSAEKGEKTVNTETKKKPEAAAEQRMMTVETPSETVDVTEIQQQAREAERTRVREITALCRSFGMDPAQYIEDGTTLDETRAAVLAELAANQKAQEVAVTADEADKFRAAATDGLAIRAGLTVETPAAGYEAFRGMSMLRLAANIYERQSGKSASRMTDEDLVRSVFSGGTGGFTTILANVGHKSMLKAYTEIPTTYQYWTARGSNTDFKKATRVGLGAADELLPMTENGEFKNADVSDYGITTQVHTFGRAYAITRKAIIDDDLGMLSDLPAKYGAAVRRMINRMAYERLVGSTDIFSADHANQGTGAITIASLAAAKTAMAKQKDPSGKMVLNLQPVYLIVPPELEVTAAQLISSLVDPTKNNAVPNPFANKFTVISDPNLTDVNAWYLTTAPGALAGIEVTYLNGKDAPTMETAVDFNTLGIKHRIYMDFGINLIDYRAFYKSTGK